jgi:hypothetical protein
MTETAMMTFRKRRRHDEPSFEVHPHPQRHLARHEDNWPTERNRILAELSALYSK